MQSMPELVLVASIAAEDTHNGYLRGLVLKGQSPRPLRAEAAAIRLAVIESRRASAKVSQQSHAMEPPRWLE